MMSPGFYSLGMLVTSRGWSEHPTLTAMDVLASAIAKEESGEPLTAFEEHTLAVIFGVEVRA